MTAGTMSSRLDYLKMYDWMLEGLDECAEHNPNVKISLEFKPKEPRMHIMINSTAKALLFVNDDQSAQPGHQPGRRPRQHGLRDAGRVRWRCSSGLATG